MNEDYSTVLQALQSRMAGNPTPVLDQATAGAPMQTAPAMPQTPMPDMNLGKKATANPHTKLMKTLIDGTANLDPSTKLTAADLLRQLTNYL